MVMVSSMGTKLNQGTGIIIKAPDVLNHARPEKYWLQLDDKESTEFGVETVSVSTGNSDLLELIAVG